MQGRLHRKKRFYFLETYKKNVLKPHYISMCFAGRLFGVITANGDIFPCEILESKKLGNLREKNMDFQQLWDSKENSNIRSIIKKQNVIAPMSVFIL